MILCHLISVTPLTMKHVGGLLFLRDVPIQESLSFYDLKIRCYLLIKTDIARRLKDHSVLRNMVVLEARESVQRD
jgi:hypothetical protein